MKDSLPNIDAGISSQSQEIESMKSTNVRVTMSLASLTPKQPSVCELQNAYCVRGTVLGAEKHVHSCLHLQLMVKLRKGKWPAPDHTSV